MQFELTLEDALMIVVHAFFNIDVSQRVPTEDFLLFAAKVCTESQLQELESKLTSQKEGYLVLNGGQSKLKFSNGFVHGLELKNNYVQICFVTTDNFDEVYQKCIAFDKPKYCDLTVAYKSIGQLRHTALQLQTQLANKTFNIMRADQTRYQSLKTRDKTIEQAKRAARRNERRYRETP